MRLALITAVVMVAFAANSVLNRAAVGPGHIGAMDFALVRVVAGAAVLVALATARDGAAWIKALRAGNVAALSIYLIGFSLAYGTLPAGAGALLLFAAVQVTMFGGAVYGGEVIPVRRWIGSGLALAGLAWMLLPGSAGLPLVGGALMIVAGVGWGAYSLGGRLPGTAPLHATAASFAAAVPVVALAWWIAGPAPANALGIGLAVLSGAVTSGLGYALWYAVLPGLGATRGAIAQLTVPVIAVAGGALLLSEEITLRLVASCTLVLGGVAFGLLSGRKRTGASATAPR